MNRTVRTSLPIALIAAAAGATAVALLLPGSAGAASSYPPATFQMYANVDSNCNLGSNVGAVSAIHIPGATGCQVTFSKLIGHCAAVAQPGKAGGNAEVEAGGADGGLRRVQLRHQQELVRAVRAARRAGTRPHRRPVHDDRHLQEVGRSTPGGKVRRPRPSVLGNNSVKGPHNPPMTAAAESAITAAVDSTHRAGHPHAEPSFRGTNRFRRPKLIMPDVAFEPGRGRSEPR